MLQLPKPEPRKRVKARQKRRAAKVVNSVREQVAERDGHCRLKRMGAWVVVGECDGPSEWAHLGDGRRFKTRGMEPEHRHQTSHTLMLCQKHHSRLDGRALPRLWIEPMSSHGADGRLCAKSNGDRVYVER